jgi:[ribosomal protein S5]-alanine N-acetyltransferase
MTAPAPDLSARTDEPATGTPTIETQRLVLRSFEDNDLAAYFAILDTLAVRASLLLPDGFNEYSAWEQMAAFSGQWTLRGTGQWAVVLKTTNELIGRCGTHHPHRHDWPGVEVGWTFHPRHWGNGYATEAGRASVDWAFEQTNHTTLMSMIRPTNVASAAVASRLGFMPKETRRWAWFPGEDHTRWELIRATWAGRASGV